MKKITVLLFLVFFNISLFAKEFVKIATPTNADKKMSENTANDKLADLYAMTEKYKLAVEKFNSSMSKIRESKYKRPVS
jgi:hypothetical protein